MSNDTVLVSAMIPGSADADFEVRTRTLSRQNFEVLIQSDATAIAVGPGQTFVPARLFAFLKQRMGSHKNPNPAGGQHWTLYKCLPGHRDLQVKTFSVDVLWNLAVHELESQAENTCMVLVPAQLATTQKAEIESLFFEALAEPTKSEESPRAKAAGQREAILKERQNLLKQVGTLSSEDIARGGGSTSANASQFAADQRNRGAIFGVRFGQQWLYPSFQFDGAHRIRPEMRDIVSALSPDELGWDRLQWFLEPHQRLTGRTPLEVWAEDPKQVLQAAQSEHWNGRD